MRGRADSAAAGFRRSAFVGLQPRRSPCLFPSFLGSPPARFVLPRLGFLVLALAWSLAPPLVLARGGLSSSVALLLFLLLSGLPWSPFFSASVSGLAGGDRVGVGVSVSRCSASALGFLGLLRLGGPFFCGVNFPKLEVQGQEQCVDWAGSTPPVHAPSQDQNLFFFFLTNGGWFVQSCWFSHQMAVLSWMSL